MISLLAKRFIREDGDEQARRKAYGVLCGAVGIGLNVLLFIGKFLFFKPACVKSSSSKPIAYLTFLSDVICISIGVFSNFFTAEISFA